MKDKMGRDIVPDMTHVVICSPYAGDVNANVLYARAAMRHSLLKGEAPYASHLLYTQPQVLNDSIEEERNIGMAAGKVHVQSADILAVYYDRGISAGMMHDMEAAAAVGVRIEFRSLKKEAGVWAEIQERGITSLWLDEQERVRTSE